jgi:hypothetical protein
MLILHPSTSHTGKSSPRLDNAVVRDSRRCEAEKDQRFFSTAAAAIFLGAREIRVMNMVGR